jgi:pimeloyl-ACP methyl ester carboxylesterase
MRCTTLWKQILAIWAHSVSWDRLDRLADHFGDAIVVIGGTEDVLVSTHNTKLLAEGLHVSDRRLIVVNGAGHFVHEQHTEQISRELMGNIARGQRQHKNR